MPFAERYRYSYSGADVKCYAFMPGWISDLAKREYFEPDLYDSGDKQATKPSVSPIHIESMHTISISIHEPRGPARALGYRNVKGFSRSVRTIAGSIIMTIIEDHPLRQLMAKDYEWVNYYKKRMGRDMRSWSVDQDFVGVGSYFSLNDLSKRIPTMIGPFNLMATYVSEAATRSALQGTDPAYESFNIEHAAWLLEDVELIGEGMTTSVNDMVTEVIYQFVARDYKEIAGNVSIIEGDFSDFFSGLEQPAPNEAQLHAQLMEELRQAEEELDLMGAAQQAYWDNLAWNDAPEAQIDGLPSKQRSYSVGAI